MGLMSISQRWDQVANDKKLIEEESGSEWAKRNALQLGARSGETIVGLPGNLKKSFKDSFNQANEFVKSFIPSFPTESEFETQEPEKGSTHEFLNDLFMSAPTSAELRKNVTPSVAKGLGKDETYLEPKTEGEKIAGEFTQDLVSFFAPGTNQFRMLTRLGAPILGNLSKQGVLYFGGDEETADKVKNGLMLLTTISGQANPERYGVEQISQARQMIPPNTTMFIQPLVARLRPLWDRLQRGLNVPSKSRARQGINDLLDQVDAQGRIDMNSVLDARDHINEWISEMGGWDIPAPTRDRAVRNLNEFKTNLIREIDTNLQARFPEAAEMYRNGYEALATYHRSNVISNFIADNFGRKVASVGAKMLFPSLAGGAKFFPGAAATGAAVLPLYKAGQVMYRVMNSPTLSRYYTNVINNAAIGNIPAMTNNLNKLDKALKKEEDERFGKFDSSKDEFFQHFQKYSNSRNDQNPE